MSDLFADAIVQLTAAIVVALLLGFAVWAGARGRARQREVEALPRALGADASGALVRTAYALIRALLRDEAGAAGVEVEAEADGNQGRPPTFGELGVDRALVVLCDLYGKPAGSRPALERLLAVFAADAGRMAVVRECVKPCARNLLTSQLAVATAAQAACLTPSNWAMLRRLVDDTEADPALRCGILIFLGQHGVTADEPLVHYQADREVYGGPGRHVQEVAREALGAMRARLAEEERSMRLVRASQSPPEGASLVRPAGISATAADALVRPAGSDEDAF